MSKLVQAKGPHHSNYNKAKVFNLTNVEIPDSILNLLELGSKRGIGGIPFDSSNYIEIGKLFNEFQKRAREQQIPETEIEVMRSHCILTGQSLRQCFTDDSRVRALHEFQRKNPDVCFVNVDKTSNICLMYKSQYNQKLEALSKIKLTLTENF